jgi:hypothetical protein
MVEKAGKVPEALMAFRQSLGATEMLAYPSMLAARVVAVPDCPGAHRRPF